MPETRSVDTQQKREGLTYNFFFVNMRDTEKNTAASIDINEIPNSVIFKNFYGEAVVHVPFKKTVFSLHVWETHRT